MVRKPNFRNGGSNVDLPERGPGMPKLIEQNYTRKIPN